MWNDEDNNPYGAFQRRDSNNSDTEHATSPASRKPDWHCSRDDEANRHGHIQASDDLQVLVLDNPHLATSLLRLLGRMI